MSDRSSDLSLHLCSSPPCLQVEKRGHPWAGDSYGMQIAVNPRGPLSVSLPVPLLIATGGDRPCGHCLFKFTNQHTAHDILFLGTDAMVCNALATRVSTSPSIE